MSSKENFLFLCLCIVRSRKDIKDMQDKAKYFKGKLSSSGFDGDSKDVVLFEIIESIHTAIKQERKELNEFYKAYDAYKGTQESVGGVSIQTQW